LFYFCRILQVESLLHVRLMPDMKCRSQSYDIILPTVLIKQCWNQSSVMVCIVAIVTNTLSKISAWSMFSFSMHREHTLVRFYWMNNQFIQLGAFNIFPVYQYFTTYRRYFLLKFEFSWISYRARFKIRRSEVQKTILGGLKYLIPPPIESLTTTINIWYS
jgi:hypothetical protein